MNLGVARVGASGWTRSSASSEARCWHSWRAADAPLAGIGPEASPLGRLQPEGPRAFPNDVKTRVGGALWDAQIGLKSPAAKPLAVYILHAFQKKSRRAIATPKSELDLIGARLSRAKRIMKHG